MSRDLYNYKRKATTAARDLRYSSDIILRITNANSVAEVARIMRTERERMKG